MAEAGKSRADDAGVGCDDPGLREPRLNDLLLRLGNLQSRRCNVLCREVLG